MIYLRQREPSSNYFMKDKSTSTKSSNPSAQKHWSQIKSHDSWSVFKVIAEMVDGFEKLAKIGPCVSIFGSARAKTEGSYYKKAKHIAKLLSCAGYGIISGGGPGIMEAANRGAQEAGGHSVGLCIELPNEQSANTYIDPDKLLMFNYFFIRKVIFVKYSQGFVVMPGGFGTLDELFEALTLIQTQKIERFPVVLVERSYWQGLLQWLRETVSAKDHLSASDFEFVEVVDTPQEVLEAIEGFYNKRKGKMTPNF